MVATKNEIQKGALCHTKADGDLENRLVNVLHERHVPRIDLLRIESRGGIVCVRGELPTSHDKWLCVECCRHVAGVIRLVDEIEVKPKKRCRPATKMIYRAEMHTGSYEFN